MLIAVSFMVFSDWRITLMSAASFLIGLFVKDLFYGKWFSRKSASYKHLAIPPGSGNAYFKGRYIDPPSGNVKLGDAEFVLDPISLIIDTGEGFRYYETSDDGFNEISLDLPEPVNKVTSVYLLINSGNSNVVYQGAKIGRIELIFRNAPPIKVDLVLGVNTREWCIGNTGDLVRQTNHESTKGVWKGLSKNGSNAVIDRLRILNYDCMNNNYLENIIFSHNPRNHPTDTQGVQYMVYAITVETK
jgi:hypothetical protein